MKTVKKIYKLNFMENNIFNNENDSKITYSNSTKIIKKKRS